MPNLISKQPAVQEKAKVKKKTIWAHPAIISAYIAATAAIIASVIQAEALHQQSLLQKALQQQALQQQALQQQTNQQQARQQKTSQQQALQQQALQQQTNQQQILQQKILKQQALQQQMLQQQTLGQKAFEQKALQQQVAEQKAEKKATQQISYQHTHPQQVLEQTAIALEPQIDKANILLSGTSTARIEEVRGFLKTDPSYQQLAGNCLKLLDHRHFIHPVHLDVINGKYKASINPNVAWLPPDKYNDMVKLKAAILTNWNELYPQHQATTIDQIVQ